MVISDFEWVLPNKVFKDYEATESIAILSPVTAEEKQYASINFYPVDDGIKEIKLKCKLNGSPLTMNTMLMVEKPITSLTSSIGATDILGSRMGLFPTTEVPDEIKFNGKVTLPEGWNPGRWRWVQIATPNRIKTTINEEVKEWSINGERLLDTFYPYPAAPRYTGDAYCFPTGTQGSAEDFPSSSLSEYKTVTVSDSFEMYIMFMPDGQESRYVPLQSVTWEWGGRLICRIMESGY